MHRLKKKLQDNLSLSSKLFLRRLYSTATKTAGRLARVPGRVAKRAVGATADRLGINHLRGKAKGYSLEAPTLAAADFDLTANLPAPQPFSKKPAGEPRAAGIQSSIIIPVFNKAEFTFQCITSLMQQIDFSENEVIVVDNASTDETGRVLSHFENFVRVIRNEENRGFVDACNQGAAVARGKYLLFLNNDTKVLPGWLDHLVETIESNPASGAVGSMFLYPDGSIQEAGAIVWKNGEAHHYGWGASPDDRRFNFAREVDYCSAASLLIKKEIFQQLGGFDRRFAPAYYEDVDLCFGVRSLGYRVIYQPMSRLVHYEGVTAGGDTAKGVKHFQITNREKFVEKWREVLEKEHLEKHLKRLDEAADRNRGRPKIIVFDERVPSPDRDAGSARMFVILKTLAKWSHVIFVPFNRPQGIQYEQALWKEGIETANAEDYRRLLKNKNVQAAIVSRPSVAEALINRIRRINSRINIVFDMVDAHFIRFEREYEIAGNLLVAEQARRYRKLEMRLARAADLVWCASPEEKQIMQSEVTAKRIAVIPTIHELHDCGKTFEERHDLLFVGNFAHKPNDDAIHFFMREIYPLVKLLLPNFKLHIVGDNPSVEISAYSSDSVKVTGYVPNIQPYWQSCRVFVAPLRFGAGAKGKVGEAMSYGLPVVTTWIGAEGFELTSGFNTLIADEPQTFAEAVAQLYSQKELWQSLSKHGRHLIEKSFTPEIIGDTIDNSIRELGDGRK